MSEPTQVPAASKDIICTIMDHLEELSRYSHLEFPNPITGNPHADMGALSLMSERKLEEMEQALTALDQARLAWLLADRLISPKRDDFSAGAEEPARRSPSRLSPLGISLSPASLLR